MNINNFEDDSERSNLQKKLPPIEVFKIKKSNRFNYNFLDYRLYMKRKYSGLDSSDIPTFINKQITAIKEYFKLVEDILYKEKRPIGVLYGLKVSKIDKDAYNFMVTYHEEVIDFFKALQLELFFVSMEILYSFDFDMRQPRRLSTNNDFESISDFNDLKNYCLLQYEVILQEIYIKTPKTDLFISMIKDKNPVLYSAIQEGIRNSDVILTKRDSIYFPNIKSNNDLGAFFQEGGFNSWGEGLEILEYGQPIKQVSKTYKNVQERSYSKKAQDYNSKYYK